MIDKHFQTPSNAGSRPEATIFTLLIARSWGPDRSAMAAQTRDTSTDCLGRKDPVIQPIWMVVGRLRIHYVPFFG
jgi:hypothetical protein